jgi:hypothetical protein
MPEPAGTSTPRGKGKGGKRIMGLPWWAWAAAAAIGLVLALVIFRKGSLTPSTPDQPSQPDQTPQPDTGLAATEAIPFIPYDWLSSIGAYTGVWPFGEGGASSGSGGQDSGGVSAPVSASALDASHPVGLSYLRQQLGGSTSPQTAVGPSIIQSGFSSVGQTANVQNALTQATATGGYVAV